LFACAEAKQGPNAEPAAFTSNGLFHRGGHPVAAALAGHRAAELFMLEGPPAQLPRVPSM
jgi:hypothetical protein